KCIGDARRDVFGLDRFRTGKVFIDSLFEQRQPAAKVGGVNRQERVLGPGLPLVSTVAQQERTPELVHRGQVFLPIDLSQIVEDRRKQLVAVHLLVKRIDE